MTAPIDPPSWNLLWFQEAPRWHLDLLSLLLGLVLGLALTYVTLRALPFVRRMFAPQAPSSSQGSQDPSRARTVGEARFHAATAAFASNLHLARDLAPIQQLFVPPRILAPPPSPSPDRLAPLASTQLATLWPELAARVATPPLPGMSLRQLLLNGRRVVLSSPAGSGKSALLAYCAFLCAHAATHGGYAFLLPVIPVLAHFGDLRLGPGVASEDSIAPLVDALQERCGGLSRADLSALLQRKLEVGDVLLLLDGWSEANRDTRAFATSWLRRLLAQYPAIQVFVATGVKGFEPLLDAGFTLSGIAPWRAAEAYRLRELWAHLFQAELPPMSDFWAPDQTALETTLRLWSLLDGAPLTDKQTPALLAASVAHFASEKASDELAASALEQSWQELAYASLRQDYVDLAPALVETIVRHMALGASPHRLDDEALGEAILRAPIFYTSRGRPRFVSTLWRDHLAAAHLARSDLQQSVKECLRDPRWAEVVRQYAFLAPVASLADWVLEAGPTPPYFDDLFRAAEWLAGSSEPGNWRQRALLQLSQLVVKPEIPNVLRQRAIAALARCPEPGVLELLHQLLQRSDPAVRQATIAAIACFEPDKSIPLLQQMFKDGDADVRVAAVHAAGWQQHDESEQLLLVALIGRDDPMRLAAVEALALGGPPSWRILRDAARDEDSSVRRAAAHGLALLDQKWTGDLLQRLKMDDEQWFVRAAATSALEARAQRRKPRPWLPPQAADLDWMVQWAARSDRAVPGGAAAMTMLTEILGTAPDAPIRSAAARSLGHVAIPAEEREAVWASLWQAARNDSSGTVREASYSTLAFLERVHGN